MITAERTSGTGIKGEWSFKGKSTETKPTDTYKGVEIANGSSFLEIDTKKLFFYDEDIKDWV
jgi:hypothetical protein